MTTNNKLSTRSPAPIRRGDQYRGGVVIRIAAPLAVDDGQRPRAGGSPWPFGRVSGLSDPRRVIGAMANDRPVARTVVPSAQGDSATGAWQDNPLDEQPLRQKEPL